jgi:hypothetical protein
MAKRPRTPHGPASASARPVGRTGRPGIVHTSLYLPEVLYEGLRVAAFRERCKIHDIVLEGIEMVLRKRGRRRRTTSSIPRFAREWPRCSGEAGKAPSS